MKVLMVCSGGMSTSIVVKALKKEADNQGEDLEIKAVGTSEFEDELKDNYDMALIAPQVRHRFDSFKKISDENDVSCEIIPPQSYTPMGAPKLLKQIQDAIKS